LHWINGADSIHNQQSIDQCIPTYLITEPDSLPLPFELKHALKIDEINTLGIYDATQEGC
jgi:hypothetical protein